MSSGSKILDEATCPILLARAKYAPSQDIEGKAVAANILKRVAWSLPDAPEMRKIWHDERTLTVDRYDKTISCSIFSGVEEEVDKQSACDFMKSALGTARRLSKLGGSVQLKAVVDTSPADNGQYNLPAAESADTVLRESVERYSVAPDGTVSNCKITITGMAGSERLGFAPATPCTAGQRADVGDKVRQETTAWRLSVSNFNDDNVR